VNQVITFLFAGSDTTANLCTMMLYMLSERPELQTRVRQELNNILKGRDISQLEHGDLNYLEYLQCFMNETLRLYSPATNAILRSV
jgi:cytochrome P450